MQRAFFRGMSFMDVIVGTALVLVIFTALVGLLRSSLQITSLAKTRAIATTVAESQMEYVRSLSYDQVGTVGGIPAGPVSQVSTTTQNGIAFPVRTLITYVDDPADGTGAADANGITTDYKRIKVSVTYFANNRTQTVDLISNYAPPGLETTNGGGTLKVSVVNAGGGPVSGASVRIVNSSVTPAIDLTTFSGVQGTVFLPGAPTSTQYQIFVTKSGYSSAQTYARDATNQNPTPGYLTVVKDQTTTGTFAIDLLASLALRTYSPVATSIFSDPFTSSTNIANTNNVVLSGGAVRLADTGNGYAYTGSIQSVAQSPTYLVQWGIAAATTSVPANTSVRLHVLDGSGNLIPDTALTGNATGFTGSVDLSGLSTSTYPSLALSADLLTSATTTTPLLQSWSLSYVRGPVPLGAVPFTLTGTKTIGSTGAGLPLYKTTVASSTDASGVNAQSLEWDAYALSLTAYDVVQACNAPPYALAPGSALESRLVVATSTPNMMLVSARDVNGAVAGASVTLANGGSYTKTVTSDACGSAYFGAVPSGTYSLSVVKAGYTTLNASGIPVSGHVFYPVSLE